MKLVSQMAYQIALSNFSRNNYITCGALKSKKSIKIKEKFHFTKEK
jgi:hypothetical protein